MATAKMCMPRAGAEPPARQGYGLNRLGRRDRDPGVEDVRGLFARLAGAGHQHGLARSDHIAGLAGWDIRPPEREPVVGQQGPWPGPTLVSACSE
jgi:hypothetical protein